MYDAFDEMDRLVENGEGETLQSILHLCHPVDTGSVTDVAALFEIYFEYIAQYIDRFQ